MIEIRNVSKAYRIFRKSRWRILDVLGLPVPRTAYDELWVLRNLNLFVPAGQRLGIIGRNGAGKSTLLRIVGRLLSPTEGKVTVRGQVQALMDLGTSFHPDFTGRQNVMAALSYNGVTGKQAMRRFDEVLEFSELEDCIDNSLKTYSAGMQARLAFSVATAIQPEILIIDEVLSAGDAYFVGKCLERMKQLTVDCGATVLFVSHDLNAVQTMCDRVIWLNSGRVVLDGEPLSVSRAYYREVQEEENLRVKARSQGLSKRLAAGLQHAGSLRGPLLFHLVTVGAPHPVGSHKIRQLRLKRGEKLLAIIPVGEESDADPHKAARLLCASGDADWSPPQRDASGHFRFYKDCEGHYGHVPFQFSLPEEKEHNGGPVLHLEVRADVELGDEIAVEIFEHETYRRLGALTPGQEWHRFEFSLTGEAPDENSGNSDGDYGETSACRFYLQTDNTDYASPPRIAFVRLRDETNRDVVCAPVGADSDHMRFLGNHVWEPAKEIDGLVSQAVKNTGDGDLPGFDLSLPFSRRTLLRGYRLVLFALPSSFHRLRVLFEHEGQLITIGEILPQANLRWQDYAFDLDIVNNLKVDFQLAPNERSRKSSINSSMLDPRIETVRFLDSKMQPVTGIQEGEDLIVEVNYHSSAAVENPIFGVSVYRLDGTALCRGLSSLGGIHIHHIRGRGKVRFVFEPFYGGPGEYLVSASIFKHICVSKHERSVFYDSHDRAYRFRVWKELGIVLDMGLARIPYAVKHLPED